MSYNPINVRIPQFNLDTEEGRQAAHRYLASGIVDLNQAIAYLKANPQSTSSTTTIIQSGGSGGGGGSSPVVGGVNDQSGQTTYTTVDGDNGVLLVLSDASPISVTLSSATAPYFIFIANIGTGDATLTPVSGTISYAGNSGAASLPLKADYACIVFYDGTNWWGFTEPLVPSSFTATNRFNWISAYNSSTGVFSESSLPVMVEFQLTSGATGTDVAGTALAWHAGSITQCVVVVDKSDAGTALQFQIKQNGTDVFTVDPTIAAGTAPGTVSTFALRLASISIATNDQFTINVLSGTTSWAVTIQLR